MRRFVVVALVLTASTSAIAKEEDFLGGTVVFARDTSLWRTDPKGKGPATELLALPGNADEVRMIRTDVTGTTILFDLAGTWWWARLDPATEPSQLPCTPRPARLLDDGSAVLCADGDGHALLVRLGPGTARSFPVPADGARLVTKDGTRSLVWADGRGVWRASLARLSRHYRLAPEAPLRGFLAAPDGSRAVGIYAGEVYEKKKKVPADVMNTFALDKKGARRMLFRDTATVIDWSWDSVWLLVQDGASACITRAVGGEYKCWKNYTAVSLSPDGKWALVLGKRAKGKDKADDDDGKTGAAAEGESGSSEEPDDPVPGALPTGDLSLFRAKLHGPYAGKPSLVETDVDGAALWLPGVPAP